MRLIVSVRTLFWALITFLIILQLAFVIDKYVDSVVVSLPKDEEREKYSSTDFGNEIKYMKFHYSDVGADELNESPYLRPVNEKNVAYVRSHISHYERYAHKDAEFLKSYDFDIDTIEKGDYFYVDALDLYDYGSPYSDDYKIYYFDIETQTLYYFYNKLEIKPN